MVQPEGSPFDRINSRVGSIVSIISSSSLKSPILVYQQKVLSFFKEMDTSEDGTGLSIGVVERALRSEGIVEKQIRLVFIVSLEIGNSFHVAML
jgi:hypothetical protein